MSEWSTRLRGRMAELRLTKTAVIRHVRIDRQTLDLFLDGALGHGLQPEQFRRLCGILGVTPDEALGAAPAVPGEAAAVLERVRALPAEDRALAADLLDRLAHHRGHRPVPDED